MNEMLEKMAWAMWNATDVSEYMEFDECRDQFLTLARNAAAALRVPDAATLRRVHEIIGPWGGHGEPMAPDESKVIAAFVDAILS